MEYIQKQGFVLVAGLKIPASPGLAGDWDATGALIHMQPRRRGSRERNVDFLRLFRAMQDGRPRTAACWSEIEYHSGGA